MEMEHSQYIKLQEQLQDHFDGRYRKIDDCEDLVQKEEIKIEKIQTTISNLAIEQAKTNTRLGIMIAILGTIAVPVLALCVKLLFTNGG